MANIRTPERHALESDGVRTRRGAVARDRPGAGAPRGEPGAAAPTGGAAGRLARASRAPRRSMNWWRRPRTRSTVTASNCCPRPTTATSSSTSKATLLERAARPLLPQRTALPRRRRCVVLRRPMGARPRRPGARWSKSWSSSSRLRRASFPNMHVYHYNHTERSSLERLDEGNRDRESLRLAGRDRVSSSTSTSWRRTHFRWARSPTD